MPVYRASNLPQIPWLVNEELSVNPESVWSEFKSRRMTRGLPGEAGGPGFLPCPVLINYMTLHELLNPSPSLSPQIPKADGSQSLAHSIVGSRWGLRHCPCSAHSRTSRQLVCYYYCFHFNRIVQTLAPGPCLDSGV